MSQLLAQAHRAPQVDIAPAPEQAMLKRLDKRALVPLVDAVQGHNAPLVKEKLAALQKSKSTGSLQDVLAARDADGYSLLHLCIGASLVTGTLDDASQTAEVLISANASVNSSNLRRETPLLLAVREIAGNSTEGRTGLAKVLLDRKADPNLADNARITPLLEAIENHDTSLVQMLLAGGGNAFLRCGLKNRATFESLCSNCPTVAASLVDQLSSQGAMPDVVHSVQGATGANLARGGPTPESYLDLMCTAVQGHNAVMAKDVVAMWEAELWPLSGLLGWHDGDGHGWLHMCVLAPPADLRWGAAAVIVKGLLAMKVDVDRPNNNGETPLWLVAREASGGGDGRTDLLRVLIDAGAEPNRANAGSRTALMEAAAVGDSPMCEVLLQAGADPRAKDAAGITAARLATASPDVAAVFQSCMASSKSDSASGGDADLGSWSVPLSDPTRTQDERARPPNQFAAFREEVMLHNGLRVSVMIKANGAAMTGWLSEEDRDGHTVLHLCLLAPPADLDMDAQLETVLVLLDAKADANRANLLGETPLLETVRSGPCLSGRLRIVNALLQAHADFEAGDSLGFTPLMEACRQDDVALADLLLRASAEPSRIDRAGKTAVDFAPAHSAITQLFAGGTHTGSSGRGAKGPLRTGKCSEVVRANALIQAVEAHDAVSLSDILSSYKSEGKNIESLIGVADADGHGLLHLCIIAPPFHLDRSTLLETVKALLGAKIKVNATNHLGESALLLAVRETAGTSDESRLTLVRYLMKNGAEGDLGDAQDTTPLMEAAMLGDAELCQVLLDRGADMRRCGAGGLSAFELAAQHPSVRKVFDAQAERHPEAEEDGMQPLQVTLRHAITQLEREVSIRSIATVCDLKKLIVRLSHRGSWRRIALLTEDGRALHDSEFLNGRTLFIIADAKSAEAQKAAEELLPEEKRWKKWSFEELQAECRRRGVFGGNERAQCLASLLEVKRWEGLSSKDIKAECSKRGLTVDPCQDKDDLLVQLKRDFSWENMGEDGLREELIRMRIPLPDPQEQTAMDRTMRARLRQVHRWETMPAAQLRRACDLRNFDAEGKSREETLEFLKSFKIYPKPKPAPKPTPGPGPRQSQQQQQQQQDWARRSSMPGAGGSDVDGSDSEDGQHVPSGLTERVRRICKKYPAFQGPFPLEMNHWSDQDVEMYLYSNGFLKPGRKTEKASQVPRKLHYQTLGLPDGAPANDVRKAYRKLALVYHPDKNPDDPESAAESFKAITEAYETLTSSFAKEPNCG